jgi:hypothetical protein
MDQTYLYMIAAADATLERTAKALKDMGHIDLAASLLKLQQDVGVEIMGGRGDEPSPGPGTAVLRNAYEPLNASRLDILRIAHDLAAWPDLKSELANLIKSLPQTAGSSENHPKPSGPF